MTKNKTAETFDYTVTRVVDAPVAKVWDVWTQANHYETWFHAVPNSVSLDVRPGGVWKATMSTPDGGQVPMTGTYQEVEPNRRLVLAMDLPGAEPTLMEMRLADLGEKTEIVLSQACNSAEERDQANEGSEVLLVWCAEYLSSI